MNLEIIFKTGISLVLSYWIYSDHISFDSMNDATPVHNSFSIWSFLKSTWKQIVLMPIALKCSAKIRKYLLLCIVFMTAY